MRLAFFITLSLLCSPSLFMAAQAAKSDGRIQSKAATYQDVVLQQARFRYYLSTSALRLGVPADANLDFEVGMAVYPPDRAVLLNDLLSKLHLQANTAVIQLTWQENALFIQVNPTTETQAMDYDTLLQSALTLIQQANDNQLPVINGRALKTALEQKNGVPIQIFKRQPHPSGSTRH